MPAFVSLGVFKNDQVTNGGSITIGESITQNRNATKQNLTSIVVGDSLNVQPIGGTVNIDQDVMDNPSMDGPDFGAPQV